MFREHYTVYFENATICIMYLYSSFKGTGLSKLVSYKAAISCMFIVPSKELAFPQLFFVQGQPFSKVEDIKLKTSDRGIHSKLLC